MGRLRKIEIWATHADDMVPYMTVELTEEEARRLEKAAGQELGGYTLYVSMAFWMHFDNEAYLQGKGGLDRDNFLKEIERILSNKSLRILSPCEWKGYDDTLVVWETMT